MPGKTAAEKQRELAGQDTHGERQLERAQGPATTDQGIAVGEVHRPHGLGGSAERSDRDSKCRDADRGSHEGSRVNEQVHSLIVELLVELRGLEPLTPSMPWRCATSCATAPREAEPSGFHPGGPDECSQPRDSP
jgi:hypothetical protein